MDEQEHSPAGSDCPALPPLADGGTLCPPDSAVAQRALPVLCVLEFVPAVSAGRKGIN